MEIERQLKLLDLELPELAASGSRNVSVNVRASIAYVAIQCPIKKVLSLNLWSQLWLSISNKINEMKSLYKKELNSIELS